VFGEPAGEPTRYSGLRSWFVLAVAVAFLIAASAAAALSPNRTRVVNLDSDPEPERIVPRQLCEAPDGTVSLPAPVCLEDQFVQRRIEIEDTCNGAPSTRVISSAQDDVYRLGVTEADGSSDRPEIFFDLRSGATGRAGDIRVVRYGKAGDQGCPEPRALFRFPSRRTLGRIPRGAAGRDSFDVALHDYTRRYRGKELRVTETYVDRDDPFCCPTFKRVTRFRFDRRRDLYVRYRTKVSKIHS
jgi:hypothetical protein